MKIKLEFTVEQARVLEAAIYMYRGTFKDICGDISDQIAMQLSDQILTVDKENIQIDQIAQ